MRHLHRLNGADRTGQPGYPGFVRAVELARLPLPDGGGGEAGHGNYRIGANGILSMNGVPPPLPAGSVSTGGGPFCPGPLPSSGAW